MQEARAPSIKVIARPLGRGNLMQKRMQRFLSFTLLEERSITVLLFKLFTTFFKIGGFTIGGGYVMLPLIEREVVVNHKWVTQEDFIDLIAVAQAAPGIIAVNSALVIGYKVAGFPGAFIAALGAALPSFLIILGIVKYLWAFRELKGVEAFMKGAAPVVVALLFAAAVSMGKKACKDKLDLLFGFFALAMSLFFGISPIVLILLGGLAGYFLYYKKQQHERIEG